MIYQIKCDENILFDIREKEFFVEDPILNLEINKVGILNFSMYPDHPYFDRLNKITSKVEASRNGKVIFRGRIINDSQSIYNCKNIECESTLAFLNDSIVKPQIFHGTPSELFTFLINNHNSQVSEDKKIKIGNITVTDANNYIRRSWDIHTKTLELINTRCIDSLGGYIVERYEEDGTYLDWLSDISKISNQTIEFGENLIDIFANNDASNIFSVVIPIGANLEQEDGTFKRITIESVNDNKDYLINNVALQKYGWIVAPVEKTTWDDVTIPSNLKAKGLDFLNKNCGLVSSTLELTALDLSSCNKSIEEFFIYEKINIKSKPHNFNNIYLLKKITIPFKRPQDIKISLGETTNTITGINLGNKQNIDNVIKRVGTIEADYVTNKTLPNIISEEIKENSIIKQMPGQIMQIVETEMIKIEDKITDLKTLRNTIEGKNELIVPDALEANVIEYRVSGKSEQKNYEGYQLFDITRSLYYNSSYNYFGINMTIDEDGTIKWSGKATEANTYYNATWFYRETDTSKLKLIPAGSTIYYKNCNPGSSTVDYNTCLMFFFQNNNGEIKRLLGDVRPHWTTKSSVTEEDLYFVGAGLWIDSSKSFNDNISLDGLQTKVLLTVGQKDNWEPYVGGNPSPNPDYLQEIKSIEGIEVDGERYLKIKNNGENDEENVILITLKKQNLFDKDNVNILNGMYINNTNKKLESLSTTKSLYIPIKPNMCYTILKRLSSRFIVMTTKESPVLNIIGTNLVNNNNAEKLTITSSDEDNYLVVFYFKNDVDTLTEQQILDSIKIYEGLDENDYWSLESLDDVKDELEVINNRVILHKNIEKITLNGSENWNIAERNDNSYGVFYASSPTFSHIKKGSALCNYFKYINYIGQVNDNKTNLFDLNYNQIRIASQNNAMTVEEFKTWLSNNPVEILYQLAEPYDVDLGQVAIPLQQGYNKLTLVEDLETNTEVTYLRDNILNEEFARQLDLDITNGELNNTKNDINNLNTDVNNSYQDLLGKINSLPNSDLITQINQKVEESLTSTEWAVNRVEEIVVNGVTQVKTGNGMTFNDDGLNFDREGAQVGSSVDEAGMKIVDKTGASNSILQYTGYVNDEIASQVPTLAKSKGSVVNYAESYFFGQHIKGKYGQLEEIEDDELGKGWGFFIGGDE